MGKVVVLLLALSLIVERVTEKILYLFPDMKKRLFARIVSTALGVIIAFSFNFGFIRELGLIAGSNLAHSIDCIITGLLIACGSEPIHSIVDGLAYRKEELKRKAKNV
ncbi:MAG: hypothetical protein N3A65_00900 [candidate division WOR-3 bacterium]|nr:hypothetical protein [candidate division WOR-3 bacterium]